MMRVLNPRIHGYLDIVFIVCFVLGPLAFGLGGTPALISFLIALTFLMLTLMTRFPFGIVKKVPFVVHGLIELGITIFTALLPRLGGYSPGSPARQFFWAMAIALAIVWLLTDYREEARTAPAPGKMPS
jgi:hypothetical protein